MKEEDILMNMELCPRWSRREDRPPAVFKNKGNFKSSGGVAHYHNVITAVGKSQAREGVYAYLAYRSHGRY